MTDDERDGWLVSLKPDDEVVHIESQDGQLFVTRTIAKIVASHPDCFIVAKVWPHSGPEGGFDIHARATLPRSGRRTAGIVKYRIDPMTDDERRRFADDSRRTWVKANISSVINNLASDDLRRVAELLGYRERQ